MQGSSNKHTRLNRTRRLKKYIKTFITECCEVTDWPKYCAQTQLSLILRFTWFAQNFSQFPPKLNDHFLRIETAQLHTQFEYSSRKLKNNKNSLSVVWPPIFFPIPLL